MSLRSEHIRKYISTVTRNVGVSEHGTVVIRPQSIRLAHAYDEPKTIKGVTRTNKIIRIANAIERQYDINAKVLGIAAYEEKIMQRRQAKQGRRQAFRAQRIGK